MEHEVQGKQEKYLNEIKWKEKFIECIVFITYATFGIYLMP